MSTAPVAVFVYQRPAEARTVLSSLLANPEAARSRIFVFSDGPRGEADRANVVATRKAAREFAAENVTFVEREQNLGLARSIIDGVSRLTREFGRAIVLEDDLTVSRTFLAYMNAALERYADDPAVWHVSGYMYPVELDAGADAVFLPFISSTGWGTWERAWSNFDPAARGYDALRADRVLRRRFDLDGSWRFFRMLERQRAGVVDSWAIRWYLSLFMSGALALYPTRSLVTIGGFGAGASNTRTQVAVVPRLFRGIATEHTVREFPRPELDEGARRTLIRFFRSENVYRWPLYKALNWLARFR